MIKRIASLGLCVWFFGSLVGCQCCKGTQAYLDFIDHKNDSCQLTLDCLYNPLTDLTRLGHPDGCQHCQKSCSPQCPYYRGASEPMYRVYEQTAYQTEEQSAYSSEDTEFDSADGPVVPPLPTETF